MIISFGDVNGQHHMRLQNTQHSKECFEGATKHALEHASAQNVNVYFTFNGVECNTDHLKSLADWWGWYTEASSALAN